MGAYYNEHDPYAAHWLSAGIHLCLPEVKFDDLSIAMLVVLFFGIGFFFGYGLNTASCPPMNVEESK